MRIALAMTADRIATVCDFAEELRLVEGQGVHLRELSRTSLADCQSARIWAQRIAASGAEVLLCGDCSRALCAELAQLGLRVVSGCTATPETALRALLAERPAACRLRRRRRCRSSTRPIHERRTSPMVIALTASARDLDAPLDRHFGRARYFYLVDETGTAGSFFDNPSQDAQHGAGLRSAAYVRELGASTVISGDIGPKAMDVLREGHCACYAAEGGSLRAVLDAWRAGSLRRID